MGSPKTEKNRKEDEGPQFRVKVEPFWMGKYEMTWDQFEAFKVDYRLYKKEEELKKRVVHPKNAPKDKWLDAVSIVTPPYGMKIIPILSGMGEKGGYPLADLTQFGARQFTKWLSRKTGRFYRLLMTAVGKKSPP